MDSDAINMFKSLTKHWCVTRHERVNQESSHIYKAHFFQTSLKISKKFTKYSGSSNQHYGMLSSEKVLLRANNYRSSCL